MVKTMELLAGIGGLATIIGVWQGIGWLNWLGGIVALVFGGWAAFGK